MADFFCCSSPVALSRSSSWDSSTSFTFSSGRVPLAPGMSPAETSTAFASGKSFFSSLAAACAFDFAFLPVKTPE